MSMDNIIISSLRNALSKLNSQTIIRSFPNFEFDKGLHVLIPLPTSKSLREKAFYTKWLLQYKYCLPIKYEIENDLLSLGDYATYKFLKIILPFAPRNKIDLWKTIIANKKESKISIYAAGAIELSPDKGIGSREIIKNSLKSTKSIVINPCDFEFNKNDMSLTNYRKVHSIHESWMHEQQIVSSDCDAVLAVDVIALWLDQYVGRGSTSECTLAKAMLKPVYAIIAPDYNIKKTPVWLLGCISRFFKSPEQFRKFILDVQ